MSKHYIPVQHFEDSFKLAGGYESGFRPNYIVGVWRGGARGIAVQEFLMCWA